MWRLGLLTAILPAAITVSVIVPFPGDKWELGEIGGQSQYLSPDLSDVKGVHFTLHQTDIKKLSQSLQLGPQSGQ